MSDASGGRAENGKDFAAEASFARLLLRQRRAREKLLGAHHFADPVWDMMLDLFAAQVHAEQIATSSVIIAANVPQSTALRRLRELVLEGLIVGSRSARWPPDIRAALG